jgi:hypothetical protein
VNSVSRGPSSVNVSSTSVATESMFHVITNRSGGTPQPQWRSDPSCVLLGTSRSMVNHAAYAQAESSELRLLSGIISDGGFIRSLLWSPPVEYPSQQVTMLSAAATVGHLLLAPR